LIPTLWSLLYSFLTLPWQEEFITTQCVPMMHFMKDPVEEMTTVTLHSFCYNLYRIIPS
jgi:hypothetical protein